MHKQTKLSGLTIVELLIVIVVIAILAAISVVAYRGIQDRANASAASSAASQASRKIQLFFTENDNYPASLTTAGLDDMNNLQYAFNNSSNPKTYCVTASAGNKSFYVSNTATTPTQGGCAGHGQGGMAAITNLATNPRGIYNGVPPSSNNTVTHLLTRNVTVPATPDGITTAIEQRVSNDYTGASLLSLYNLDGLTGSSGITRSISAWVRVNTSGYRVSGSDTNFPIQDLAANVWVRVQTDAPVPGNEHVVLRVQKISGSVALSDRAYITGIMSVEGSQHYSFADGNSPNWVWNGTTNNSASTGPAL